MPYLRWYEWDLLVFCKQTSFRWPLLGLKIHNGVKHYSNLKERKGHEILLEFRNRGSKYIENPSGSQNNFKLCSDSRNRKTTNSKSTKTKKKSSWPPFCSSI